MPQIVFKNKADVHVVDISKGGIAFKSGYDFKVNSFYDTVITLANWRKALRCS